MKKLKFSLFESLNGISGSIQTTPTGTLNFTDLINYYKSTENKQLSERILTAPTEEIKTILKNKRAYYTPSGVFSYRKNNCLTSYNNVISIDIDNLSSTKEAKEIRSKLATHKSILFCLLSARGKGVKGLMLVNATYTPEDQHKQLKNVFKPYLADFLNIDANCIDTAQFVLSQPCYFSYDTEMYVNENAEILELFFNYKEPIQEPYTPTKVPADVKNRIEAYMLSILNNKISAFNPNTARHPQLFSAKLLGQLIHYAPHLEGYILNEFISAGVSMYGTETMRHNVAKSVNDAFNEGVNHPQNHIVIDEIIKEEKPYFPQVKKETKKAKSYQLKTNYLANDKRLYDLIKDTILKNKITILTAPTGTGKSFLFKKYAEEIKEQIIFLAPLKTIVEQQKESFQIVTGDIPTEQIRIAERYKLLFCTYASAKKLSSAEGKILVIDESHLLSDRSNILNAENKHIYKMIEEAKHVVFVSATTNKLLASIFNAEEINIKSKEETKKIQPIFYNSAKTKLIDAIIKWNRENIEGVNVVFLNDKSQLKTIHQDIIKLGILKANQIVKFTADAYDVKTDAYNTLIKNQIINEGVKLVLCTSKIGEGVNINNSINFNILFVGSKDTNHLIQSIGRFRKSKKVTVSVLFSQNFTTNKGAKYDDNALYKDLLKVVQRIPKLFNEFSNKIENNLPKMTIDWKERSVFYYDDSQNIVNSFEILYQIKKIKESYFDFDLWKEEVKILDSNIVFVTPVTIDAAKNKELENTRKHRKEERQAYLEKVRNILNSSQAGSVLVEVRDATKNLKLKSYVNELLYDFDNTTERLGTDDLILFFDNYDIIEMYVSNITELMTATSLDYFNISDHYVFNENYKPAKYLTLLKRYAAATLEEKGASNIEEAKMLHSIKEIEKAFEVKFTQTDTITLSKNEIFKITRRKLNYRYKTENTSTLNSKIGVCFDISYCKYTKEYTLKKVSKSSDLKTFDFKKEKEKKVNAQSHAIKGREAIFKPTKCFC